MELVDNAFHASAVPARSRRASATRCCWWSLGVSLAIAFVAAFPVNRALIAPRAGTRTVVSPRTTATERTGIRSQETSTAGRARTVRARIVGKRNDLRVVPDVLLEEQ